MNPLEKLMPQQQAMPRPAPTIPPGEAMAGIHRFSSVRAAMASVLADPKLGRENIRPKLLDAGSKLLASKVLSLPELMNAIKDLPDDPVKQRQFVDNIFNSAGQAREVLMQQYQQHESDDDGWSLDKQGDLLSSLLGKYDNGRD